MDEFENFVENGEFFVEYADHYLGSGSVVWSLLPQMLEARRDGRTALQLRSISNIKWQLKITLDGGDQFWNLFDSKDEVDFSGFSGSIFSCGGVLKLFPTDPLQKGFCFCRCFPEKITRSSGSRQNAGTLELEFVCEAEKNTGRFFQRMDEGIIPEKAVLRKQPDMTLISRKLLDFLGGNLKLTPGKDLNLNFFAPVKPITAMLELNGCREWRFNAPHLFDCTLLCRCLPAEKAVTDQKMYAAATALNDCRITLEKELIPWSAVKLLEFDGAKVVNGATFFESTCKFSLLFN